MTDTCIPVSGYTTRGLVRVMLSCHSEAHGRGSWATRLKNYKCKNSAVTNIRRWGLKTQTVRLRGSRLVQLHKHVQDKNPLRGIRFTGRDQMVDFLWSLRWGHLLFALQSHKMQQHWTRTVLGNYHVLAQGSPVASILLWLLENATPASANGSRPGSWLLTSHAVTSAGGWIAVPRRARSTLWARGPHVAGGTSRAWRTWWSWTAGSTFSWRSCVEGGDETSEQRLS